MNVAVLTIFPEMFSSLTEQGVVGKAIRSGLVNFKAFNPRDFTSDARRTVDDRPYGGGPGMVMLAEPLEGALIAAKQWLGQIALGQMATKPPRPVKVVYLSPQGQRLTQKDVKGMASKLNDLVLIAGRYEGIDERFVTKWVDQEWSIGDYVLSGGELPAMVMVDALTRILPGALGDNNSACEDSFEHGLLDCPHYTRPAEYQGEPVPSVLLSGDHEKIAQWRMAQAIERTQERRPDLLDVDQREDKLEQYRRGLKNKYL